MYFPYYDNNRFTEFVENELAALIKELTNETDLSDQDYCAKLLLGVLVSDKSPLTVEELLKKAGGNGYPNPFWHFSEELPDWLEHLFTRCNLKYTAHNSKVKYSYNGFESMVFLRDIMDSHKLSLEKISEINVLVKELIILTSHSSMLKN